MGRAALGTGSPAAFIVSRNRLRSSAMQMALSEAPISSTPYLARTPISLRARLNLTGLPADGRQHGDRAFLRDDASCASEVAVRY